MGATEQLNLLEHLEALLAAEIKAMKTNQKQSAGNLKNSVQLRNLANTYKDITQEKRTQTREEHIDIMSEEEKIDALLALIKSLTETEKQQLYRMLVEENK